MIIIVVIAGIVLLLAKGCFSKDKKVEIENKKSDEITEENVSIAEDISEDMPKVDETEVDAISSDVNIDSEVVLEEDINEVEEQKVEVGEERYSLADLEMKHWYCAYMTESEKDTFDNEYKEGVLTFV